MRSRLKVRVAERTNGSVTRPLLCAGTRTCRSSRTRSAPPQLRSAKPLEKGGAIGQQRPQPPADRQTSQRRRPPPRRSAAARCGPRNGPSSVGGGTIATTRKRWMRDMPRGEHLTGVFRRNSYGQVFFVATAFSVR